MVVNFEWTDLRIAKLRDLADAGATTRAMALELGCSRNAAIGKCNRLGLSLAKKREARKAALVPRVKARANVRVIIIPHDPEYIRKHDGPFLAKPGDELVGFGSLEAFITQCRWPKTDGAGVTRYCGKAVTTGSYCAAHGLRAYNSSVKPSPRNDLRPIIQAHREIVV